MTLHEYLGGADSAKVKAFAERIGVTPTSVRRYLRGERLPGRNLIRAIAKATQGAVTANDFYLTDAH